MLIVCSWCGKYLGEKAPLRNKSKTHTICEECLLKNFPDIYQKMYGDKETSLQVVNDKPDSYPSDNYQDN